MEKFLSKKERKELRRQHRRETERRYADRLKALLLWAEGWILEEICHALLIEESSIRRWRKWYEAEGLGRLLNDDWGGRECRLSEEQETALVEFLNEQLCNTTAEVCEYVKAAFRVTYSLRGMQHVLKRLGFVYKKTKSIPGKADPEAQRSFVRKLKRIKARKGKDEPLYYLDGTHPLHNSQPSYGWILKGKERQIPANTGRRRLNLNAALNAETHKVVFREDTSVNAQSTTALLKQLIKLHPKAKRIYVVLDNARYYRSRLVKEFVADSKIRLLFLPPYAPNLNLIERLWKFFKKKILANRYYERFAEFRKTCCRFLKNLGQFKKELKSLLNDKFQIIEPSF